MSFQGLAKQPLGNVPLLPGHLMDQVEHFTCELIKIALGIILVPLEEKVMQQGGSAGKVSLSNTGEFLAQPGIEQTDSD